MWYGIGVSESPRRQFFMDAKQRIIEVKKEFPKHYVSLLARKHPEIFLTILEYNDKFGFTDATNAQKIYNFLNNVIEAPLCLTCGIGKRPFNSHLGRYGNYCSKSCWAKNPQTVEKRRTTRINKKVSHRETYATEAARIMVDKLISSIPVVDLKHRVEEYQNSIKDKHLFRIGLIAKHKDVYKTIRENYADSETEKGFQRAIYLILHDMREPPKCKWCGIKDCRFVNLEQGFKTWCDQSCESKLRTEKILESRRELEDQGCSDSYPAMSLDHTVEKAQNFVNAHNSRCFLSVMRTQQPELMKSIYFHTRNMPKSVLFTERIFTLVRPKEITSTCPTCGGELTYASFNNGYRTCSNCITGTSTGEIELLNFVKEIYTGEIRHRDKSTLSGRFEIDIFLPEKKIGFEYCGLYWHCEAVRADKLQHRNKLNLANANGIQLIQIFEDEWKFKREIVESIVASKLGVCKRKIGARNCVVKKISSEEKSKFLDENHLQGNDKSSNAYGLYFKDELVSVMTFGKRKITGGSSQLEMIRFCTKKFVSVVGGASRLLKAFLSDNKDTKSIITYADMRYSNGNLYETIGFKKIGVSKPNYWYFGKTTPQLKRYHRANFQKHRLNRILQNYDPSLTEQENMKNNGYNVIWDCGSIVFQLDVNQNSC